MVPWRAERQGRPGRPGGWETHYRCELRHPRDTWRPVQFRSSGVFMCCLETRDQTGSPSRERLNYFSIISRGEGCLPRPKGPTGPYFSSASDRWSSFYLISLPPSHFAPLRGGGRLLKGSTEELPCTHTRCEAVFQKFNGSVISHMRVSCSCRLPAQGTDLLLPPVCPWVRWGLSEFIPEFIAGAECGHA